VLIEQLDQASRVCFGHAVLYEPRGGRRNILSVRPFFLGQVERTRGRELANRFSLLLQTSGFSSGCARGADVRGVVLKFLYSSRNSCRARRSSEHAKLVRTTAYMRALATL